MAVMMLLLAGCGACEDCDGGPPYLNCIGDTVEQYAAGILTIHHCTQGCRVEFANGYPAYDNLSALCREAVPHDEGDSCRDRSDCMPAQTAISENGVVTNVNLDCDHGTDRCVRVMQRPPASYLSSCDASAQRGMMRTGVTLDAQQN